MQKENYRMTQVKRIVALLLVLLLLMAGLSGCRQKSDADKTPSESPAVTEAVPAETEQPEDAAPTPESSEQPGHHDKDKKDPNPQPPKKEEPSETPKPEKDTPEKDNKDEFKLSDVQPVVKAGKYQYNPYLLSKEAIRSFDKGFLAFYKDFLTAYMNYETSCKCSDVEYAQRICMVLDYECSFYTGDDIDLNWATNYDFEAGRLNWTYQVDKNTLQTRIRQVAAVMQDFLNKVKPTDNEADKMQALYHAFCPLMSYDHDSAISREKIDACYALLEHRGICVTFSYAFAQILAQADIDATIGSGLMSDGDSHVWNYANINGQYYFFDTTFELNYHNGNAYVYYGMTLDERLSSGVLADMTWLGRYQDYELVTAETHLNVH